jgi:phosphodiesterase/alkaline phosphatase D-like protein
MKQAVLLVGIVLLTCVLALPQSGSGSYGTQTQSSQITNGPVAEYVADSKATIGWSVQNSGANMTVKYGTDRDHMDQTAQATPGSDGRNFHARLQGLSSETRYYFQVMQDNQPAGGVGTFRTVASGAAPVKSRATIPQ